MELRVRRSELQGKVAIPGSKSHTIRALVIASLAEGRSVLRRPLVSADAEAAVRVCRAFGAEIELGEEWVVNGVAGKPLVPADVVDVGNSGTTLYVCAATAALVDGYTVFTGDEQIRRRPVELLLGALRDLGAEAFTTRGDGCAPFVVRGPMRGGKTVLDCPTSQYLTALLLNAPLAQGDTEIEVPRLNERPYVQMTLDWLDGQRIRYQAEGMEHFVIPGCQSYKGFEGQIPADWSSATFFLCAGALGQGEVRLTGLELTDSQGDKAVVEMLRKMGARVEDQGEDGIVVSGGHLHGAELDLNATPDALPALAATACFAEGETRLVNVAQARLKETDRIAVMAEELRKMGAEVEEREDGLVIRGTKLRGAKVHGHGDHRVVRALAVAGMKAEGETVVDTAEAMAVTFPDFAELMRGLGGEVSVGESLSGWTG